MSLSFFAERERKKSILELKSQKHFFRALRTPILCLVQLSKLRECEATDAQNFFLSQKKCLKCNFKRQS